MQRSDRQPDGLSAKQTAYRGRDVVNAPQIKLAIAARSSQRGDSAALAAWLANHFFRWTVGCFEPAEPVTSAEQYLAWSGETALPAWLAQGLAAAQSGRDFFYIDPNHERLLELERKLVEFLHARVGTRMEHKLQRLTCPQALALWSTEHERMQHRSRREQEARSGPGLREILRVDHGRFCELIADSPDLREELVYESLHMRHCLGQFENRRQRSGGYGEHYAREIAAGRLRVFSLRDVHNRPHVTISLRVGPRGLSVDQIKGKQNRVPHSRYVGDALRLLQRLEPLPEACPDCDAIGLVHETDSDGSAGGWRSFTTLHDEGRVLSMLARRPYLLEQIETPSAAMRWAAISMAPAQVAGQAGTLSAAMRMAVAAHERELDGPLYQHIDGELLPGLREGL